MPRVSKQQAIANRRGIVSVSSQLFRERGFAGVSVFDLTAAAGLTHGGFYGHFASKQALEAEALRVAFEGAEAHWSLHTKGAQTSAIARRALVTDFLSSETRNRPGLTCPTASLSIDVARSEPGSAVRGTFEDGLQRMLSILASVELPLTSRSRRASALVDLSTMVGALVLARATQGSEISDELLDAARSELLADYDGMLTQPRAEL